jgi:serine/threonine protein phosphatase PrpC
MAATLIFRSVSRTHAGLVRPSNEDALLALDGRKLWAVSDGMGGHSGGAIASKAVVDRLAALSAEDNRPSLEQRARAGLAAVNLELCDRNDTANPPTNMGATIALLGIFLLMGRG